MSSPQHREILEHYGLFMVTWSLLESVVQAGIMLQSELTPQKTLIFTSSMQFRQRVAVLSSLLQLSGSTHSEALSLLRKIEKKAKRNMLVHGHVVVGDPSKLTFVKSSVTEDNGLRSAQASFTGAEMINHIKSVVEEVSSLQKALSVTNEHIQMLGNAVSESIK